MGLFDKFKKKNVESANKKTETTVETKPDDTFEQLPSYVQPSVLQTFWELLV